MLGISNMTAAASDDEAMLAVFERLALEAGRLAQLETPFRHPEVGVRLAQVAPEVSAQFARTGLEAPRVIDACLVLEVAHAPILTVSRCRETDW